MTKDINKDKYPEETKLKLQIFAESFKEWFPVFIHSNYITDVFIYDFFAGSGNDVEGSLGSPLILLDVAKGENCVYCAKVREKDKKIHFSFNEKDNAKQKTLVENINLFMNRCLFKNCVTETCVYDYKNFSRSEFKEIFQSNDFQTILKSKKYGKFIILDQYGFSQVGQDIFLRLVNAPVTDFIFFVSSSYIRRFKEEPATKLYFDTKKKLISMKIGQKIAID